MSSKPLRIRTIAVLLVLLVLYVGTWFVHGMLTSTVEPSAGTQLAAQVQAKPTEPDQGPLAHVPGLLPSSATPLAPPHEAGPATNPWDTDDDLATLGAETDYLTIRRRILTHHLHEFRRYREMAGDKADPYCLEVRQLHLGSIATLLDAQGRYALESTLGPHKGALEELKAASRADNAFMMNDRVYVFRRGEYPEYDRAIAHALATTADRRARKALDILDWRGHLDAEYLDAVEARAIEALTGLYSL